MSTTPQAPIVMKFGGAALADGAGVRRVGAIIAARGGERPVAVVSAALGVTELLLSVAAAAVEGRMELERVRIRHRSLLSQCGLEQELLNRLLTELAAVLEGIRSRRSLSARERDFVLSFGERMSARIVAAALRDAGHSATPVDAFDLGLLSDSNHGCARPLAGHGASIRRALHQVPGIPVVTGFVAKDVDGHLTTLGRNGSDLSASLLGEAAQALEVQFWKAVGGVMSADPKQVPTARPIAQLSYEQAAEYAFRGANVLHPGALEPLERAAIPARVLSVLEPAAAGTRIGADCAPRAEHAVGLCARRKLALVHLELGADEDAPARTSDLCASLSQARLEPLWVCSGARELSVALPWNDEAARFFAARGERMRLERELALVALVGPNVAALGAARVALDEAAIAVCAHATTSASALFAVEEARVGEALRCMHAAVFEVPSGVRA